MTAYQLDQTVNEDGTYTLDETLVYRSPRYNKTVTCPAGMVSDGATGAIDITSRAWWVHDRLCNEGGWDDGTPLSNWQCSQVLQDLLREDGRQMQAFGWFWATWIFGGGQARKNGMFKCSQEVA